LARLAQGARPRVEIVTIGERKRQRAMPLIKDRAGTPEAAAANLEGDGDVGETIAGHPVRRFSRPLRPSVLAGIMRPAKVDSPSEQYTSPVVGGEQTVESWNRVLEGRNKAHSALSEDGRPRLSRMESVMTNNTTTTTTGTNTTTGETEASGSQAEDLEIVPSPNISPRFGALRELGPIPAAMRTIKADFEAALPVIQHDRRGSGTLGRRTPAIERMPRDPQGGYFSIPTPLSITGSISSASGTSEHEAGSERRRDKSVGRKISWQSPSVTSAVSAIKTDSSEDGVTAPHRPITPGTAEREKARVKDAEKEKGKGKPLRVKSGLDDGIVLKEKLRGESGEEF